MNEQDIENDTEAAVTDTDSLDRELGFLFTPETVVQARLIDAADLNLNEAMIKCISGGVNRLKALRHDPNAQAELIRNMSAGERLVLCMWIMDMDLIEKIRSRPYPL